MQHNDPGIDLRKVTVINIVNIFRHQISLRPTSSLTSNKKEEEAKPEEPPPKPPATAVNLIIKDKQQEKPKTKKNLLSKPEYERRVEISLKQNAATLNIENAVQALKLITTAQS